MSLKNIIVVDGANVAYEEKSKNGSPRVSNLKAVHRVLKEKGFEPIIIVDAALQYKIDDKQQLEKLIDDQTVRQAPAGTDADYFILETAKEHTARIVTNDKYLDYQGEYPWIEERRIPLMIINGEVELYENGMEISAD
jgi:hypothetical protein